MILIQPFFNIGCKCWGVVLVQPFLHLFALKMRKGNVTFQSFTPTEVGVLNEKRCKG